MKSDLIQTYKKAAELHGEGTLHGDSNKTNFAYDTLTEVYTELKNSDSVQDLQVLIDDSDPSVRTWSAMHVLPICEDESIRVLKEVSKEKSLVGFPASTVLKEWKAGTLRF
jgi:hypothetical protein